MTRCEKLFACFLSCFFNLSVYSQDLKKATVDYFTGNHYYFDNTLISNEKINIAKNMLKKNMSMEDISDVTGLTINEINNLK